MLLAFLALPGSDVECEDGEFEFNWPSFDGYYDGVVVAPPIYVEPGPCCWY